MSQTAVEATSAGWRDYYELTKPRVVMLMLLCAAVGAFLAVPGLPHMPTLLALLVGMALVAGSAAVINHVADAAVDARMARTCDRPVATGRVSVSRAVLFSAITGIAGMAILLAWVNPLTAWLNLLSWLGYGLVYTLYLKRATSQNIVIGGLFGAAPPLFGWTAMTGSIDAGGLLLVLIIFVWTPPHFWALALDRIEEYSAVDIPMLPVTHGEQYTRLQILLYTLLLVAVTLMPVAIGMSGLLYLAAAIALGVGFLYWAVVLYLGNNERAAIETFRYSLYYLGLLFAALLVDHYVHWPPAGGGALLLEPIAGTAAGVLHAP